MFSWTDFFFKFSFLNLYQVCVVNVSQFTAILCEHQRYRDNSYFPTNLAWNLFIDFLHLFWNLSSYSAVFLYSKEQQLFSMMQLTRRRGTVLFVHFEPVVLPKQGI